MLDIDDRKTIYLSNVYIFIKGGGGRVNIEPHYLSAVLFPRFLQQMVTGPCSNSKEGNTSILLLHENVHLFSCLLLYSVVRHLFHLFLHAAIIELFA